MNSSTHSREVLLDQDERANRAALTVQDPFHSASRGIWFLLNLTKKETSVRRTEGGYVVFPSSTITAASV